MVSNKVNSKRRFIVITIVIPVVFVLIAVFGLVLVNENKLGPTESLEFFNTYNELYESGDKAEFWDGYNTNIKLIRNEIQAIWGCINTVEMIVDNIESDANDYSNSIKTLNIALRYAKKHNRSEEEKRIYELLVVLYTRIDDKENADKYTDKIY